MSARDDRHKSDSMRGGSPVNRTAPSQKCPVHGTPRHRARCRGCNSAYMRSYLAIRRKERPIAAMLSRARSRAQRSGIEFSLELQDISIPEFCPVLGIPIRIGEGRQAGSPSLDRIVPSWGYMPDNVRVISDHANRLKSDHSLKKLRELAANAAGERRAHYLQIISYVERADILRCLNARAADARKLANSISELADRLGKIEESTRAFE